MKRLFIPLAALMAALALAATETKKKSSVAEPKTFAEKEKIAVEMKKIAKQLDVKCEYCHTDAERGLKEGDYTLLTKEGEYAHEEMFPISEKFKVECSHCHMGGSDMTKAGDRAHKDLKFMSRYKKEHKKTLTCTTCHIPGEKGQEFRGLTVQAKKLLP
jgi:hypothetical protein